MPNKAISGLTANDPKADACLATPEQTIAAFLSPPEVLQNRTLDRAVVRVRQRDQAYQHRQEYYVGPAIANKKDCEVTALDEHVIRKKPEPEFRWLVGICLYKDMSKRVIEQKFCD